MMARTFNGTSDYASTVLNLSSYSKLSLACWFYWNAFANDSDQLAEYTPVYGNNSFMIIPNDPTGKVQLYTVQPGGGNGGTFTRPSAAQWHHGVFTFDRNGTTALQTLAYIDGVAQVVTQTSSFAVTGNFDNSTLYFMSRGGASLFSAGRLADIGMWGGVLLTEEDSMALFTGSSFPSDIRPLNLIGYWPLCGSENPEPDQSLSNADMTIVGTTRVRHFRINPMCLIQASSVPLSVFE